MKRYGQIDGHTDIRTNRDTDRRTDSLVPFHSERALGADTNKKYLGFRVECPKSLPHFKIICSFWTDFNKIFEYKISQKYVQSKTC